MALEERQLLLNESVMDTLKQILGNQQSLKEQNERLQQQNAELRNSLASSEAIAQQRSRRRSKVHVPLELAKRFRSLYDLLVKRDVIQPFDLDERPDSDHNEGILTILKQELVKENGGANTCQWTDFQIETQFKTYFRTKRDRKRREVKGTNRAHLDICKSQRRINAKLERRMTAFNRIKSSLDQDSIEKMGEILRPEFMSSEESEEDEAEAVVNEEVNIKKRTFKIRKLQWERKKLRNMKRRLDNEYVTGLTAHGRAMMFPRSPGPFSERAAPNGPSWAVRDE